MDFNYSDQSLNLQEQMKSFFEKHIFPNEQAYEDEIINSGDPLF